MIKAIIGNNAHRDPYFLDENTTLRDALEQAGVDYAATGCSTSIDGITLNPGDIDKTFADFGIKEKCFLLSVVKAVNAASIKILGNAAFVVSGAKLATIKMLEKYRPGALSLFEGEGAEKEEVFRVGVGHGDGSVSKYGVSFGATPDKDGNALVALRVPEGTADAKKWAADTISTAILKLNKVENQFAAATEEITAELAEIEANIEVM